MLNSVRDELRIQQIKEIDFEGLKVQGAQDSICIDDLNVKPLVDGTLHSSSSNQ